MAAVASVAAAALISQEVWDNGCTKQDINNIYEILLHNKVSLVHKVLCPGHDGETWTSSRAGEVHHLQRGRWFV